MDCIPWGVNGNFETESVFHFKLYLKMRGKNGCQSCEPFHVPSKHLTRLNHVTLS